MKKILFTSDTCGPCFGLKKRIEKEELSVEILNYNVEAEKPDFEKYGIRAVPRLVIDDEKGQVEIIQGSDDIIKAIKGEKLPENLDED